MNKNFNYDPRIYYVLPPHNVYNKFSISYNLTVLLFFTTYYLAYVTHIVESRNIKIQFQVCLVDKLSRGNQLSLLL